MAENNCEVKFVEKGDKIVLEKNYAPVEMDSKEVIVSIVGVEAELQKNRDRIIQMQAQITASERAIEINGARLKDIKRFEEKMLNMQESKAKAIYNEIREECKKETETEYKNDEALTEEQNKRQMFAIYQRKIATHKRSADELAPSIIKKMYYKESILENPFK